MGEVRVDTPASSFAERFWTIARDPDHSHEPQPVVMHAVQAIQRLEKGGPNEPPGQAMAALYGLLREDAGQRYAPPELIAGHPMTQRSLVYAVGVLLYERVTGQHPFGGQADVDGTIAVDYGLVPPRLAGALRRAMAARPEERFGNLAMMRLRLEEFLRGQSTGQIEVRPLTQPPISPRREAEPEPPPPRDPERSVISDFAAPAKRRRTPPPAEILPLIEPPPPDTEVADLPDDVAFRAEEALLSTPPREMAAATVHHTPGASPDRYREEAAAPRPRRPWLWAVGGAAVAAVAVYLVTRPEPPQPQPVSREPLPMPEPRGAAAPPAPRPDGAPPTPQRTFDPERAGVLIAERSRECFEPARIGEGAHYGFSAVFGLDGTIKRLWFPSEAELSEAEEACLIRQAAGLSAGGPSSRVVIVNYGVKLGREKTEVKIRGKR